MDLLDVVSGKEQGKGDVLSTKDVSNLLGISVATVQKLVETNALQAWKTKGGHRRILKKSVLDYASKNKGIDFESANRFKLLIIEDNLELSKLYKIKITEWEAEFDYKIVNSGIEGLMEIAKNKPDLLILDLKMKGIDGFEVLSLIRNDSNFSSIDVMLVTGIPRSELEKQINSKEFIILEKPFSFDFLHGYLAAKIINKKRSIFKELN